MLIHLLTIHPALVYGPLETAILSRARERGLVDVRVSNPRQFAAGPHQAVDDYPYGGGVGLVMRPEPIYNAVENAIRQGPFAAAVPPAGLTTRPAVTGLRVLLMDPGGVAFNQAYAADLAQAEHLIFVCARYEGFDERVRLLATDEITLGDFVLTGGELPALAIIDAVSRLLPGVLGDDESATDDSFATGLLEGPQYTRPRVHRGLPVPEILLSGDHEAITRWRRQAALNRTWRRRPDLLAKLNLSAADRALLTEAQAEAQSEAQSEISDEA